MNQNWRWVRSVKSGLPTATTLLIAGVLLIGAGGTAAKKTKDVRTWQLPLSWPESTPLCGRFTSVSVNGAAGDQVTEWLDETGKVLFKALRVGVQKVELDEAMLRTQKTFLRTQEEWRSATLRFGCRGASLNFGCERWTQACEWTIEREAKNPLTQAAAAKEDSTLAILADQRRWKAEDPALATAALALVEIAADTLELACTGDICKSSVAKDIAALRSLRAADLKPPTFDVGRLGSVRFEVRRRQHLQVSCEQLGEYRKCYLSLDDPPLRLYDDAHENSHRHELRAPSESWQADVSAYRLDIPNASVHTRGKLLR